MTEAALFYESESAGLGFEFLDDVQRVVQRFARVPKAWSINRPWDKTSVTSSISVLADLFRRT